MRPTWKKKNTHTLLFIQRRSKAVYNIMHRMCLNIYLIISVPTNTGLVGLTLISSPSGSSESAS